MGTFKSSTFKAASIYDPATGDVALMTTLLGGDTFFAPVEIIPQQTTNSEYQSGFRYRVQFACSDWDAYAQLAAWFNPATKTKVRAVAAAATPNAANLQWYESVHIQELRKIPKPRRADGDSHFIVALMFEGGKDAAIFNNVNLLHQVNVNGVNVEGFVDTDADGKADGYVFSDTQNEVYLAGSQTVEVKAPGNIIVSRKIVFPISSIKIMQSLNMTVVAETGRIDTLVESQTFAAAVISSSLKNSLIIGINETELSLGNTIFHIDCRIIRKGIAPTAGESMTFKEPCLRTDGIGTYIAG